MWLKKWEHGVRNTIQFLTWQRAPSMGCSLDRILVLGWRGMSATSQINKVMLPFEWETWHIPLIPELCPHNLLQHFANYDEHCENLMVASCNFKSEVANWGNLNREIPWKKIMLQTIHSACFHILTGQRLLGLWTLILVNQIWSYLRVYGYCRVIMTWNWFY